jgi:hypothetical protein
MTAEGVWWDGNALAGLLYDVFGTEMTTAVRSCPNCGLRCPVGAYRAYLGAGAALRCPGCDGLALRIAVLPDRHVVQLSGTWTLETPRR